MRVYDVLRYDAMVSLASAAVLFLVASFIFCILRNSPNFVTSQVKLIMIVAVCDMINNVCLLTGGDTNIHGLSMIYIFETCSEVLLTITLWRTALRYWTSSLTFDSTLVEAEAEKAKKKKDRQKNLDILQPRKKLKRLPISE